MSLVFEPKLSKPVLIDSKEEVVPFIIRVRGAKASKTRSIYLIAMDNSLSMDGDKIFFSKEAIIQLLKLLDPEDYVTIYSFCGKVHRILGSEKISNIDKIAKTIAGIKLGGGTNIYRLLDYMYRDIANVLEELKKEEGEKVLGSVKMILVTDGIPTLGVKDENKILELAERVGQYTSISLIIGVGNDYNEKLLMGIASKTHGFFEHLNDPSKMPKILENVMSRYRSLSAKDVKLFIKPAPSIGVYIYNRSAYVAKSGLEIDVGDVHEGDTVDIVGEFIVPPQKRGMVYLASIGATYIDNEGRASEAQVSTITIPCVHNISPEDIRFDEVVFKEVNLVRMAMALARDMYGSISADKLKNIIEELTSITITIDSKELYTRTLDLKAELEKEGLSPEIVKRVVALISRVLSGRYM